MTLPSTITPITVTGSYLLADGSAGCGTVSFTPSIAAAVTGAVLPISPLTVELDDDGAFTTILAATDDADWEASGFTYLVTERIRGARVRSYSIEVPVASPGGALDLATTAPVVAAAEVSQFLRLTGGTMTGAIVLPGNPVAPLEAAPKQYVDSAVATGDALKVSKTGDSMTGTLAITPATSVAAAQVTQATDQNSIYVLNTTAAGNVNQAHFRGDSATVNSLLLTGRVTGDTTARLRVGVDGFTAWGTGTGAVDTNLYRGGADLLKTDDKFVAVMGLGVGNSAVATTLGSVVRKVEIFSSSGVSLGFIPVYNSIT